MVDMGNWRSVDITGSIAPEDVSAARRFVNVGDGLSESFHPLCNPGPSLCGLGDWVRETINASGNLAERDYAVEDVRETLVNMVAAVPSLELKVHCGGAWESKDCIATITVHDGEVTVGDPEMATVGEMIGMQGAFRLGQILGGR